MEVNQPEEIATQLEFADKIAQIDMEMKRLGWTKDQGKDYLAKTYGRKSRQLLSDEELKEFLGYLQSCA